MKIILGTVQFGLPYGINNSSGIPDDNSIRSILSYACEEGISMLDTAPAYGNSESKIEKLSPCHFGIVTKFSKVKTGQGLVEQLYNSLSELKRDTVYGYIAHQADELIENPLLWEIMQLEKAKGKIKKIGYSLYTPSQLEKLIDMGMIPDLVQLPYSLLDRKFEQYFSQLKSKGVEIHVRSVFLQGLYFMNTEKLPQKLIPLQLNLKELGSICLTESMPIGSMALKFVDDNSSIDKIVIGVDVLKQLKENVASICNYSFNDRIQHAVRNIQVANIDLLNPVNW
jgi:aryl-alcohol dehydrogenase-like predicted oxidoreductase